MKKTKYNTSIYLNLNVIPESLKDWYKIVKPILHSREFQKRKTFRHHGDITVYEHCITVSIGSYFMAIKLGVSPRNATIAGLLHDFYTKPWQEITEELPLFKQHGFTHAKEALDNSRKYYKRYLNKRIENTILRHMFPLNIMPPRYIEGWIVTYIDKRVSFEVLKQPRVLLKIFSLIDKS